MPSIDNGTCQRPKPRTKMPRSLRRPVPSSVLVTPGTSLIASSSVLRLKVQTSSTVTVLSVMSPSAASPTTVMTSLSLPSSNTVSCALAIDPARPVNPPITVAARHRLNRKLFLVILVSIT
jgi:hypothetical protein